MITKMIKVHSLGIMAIWAKLHGNKKKKKDIKHRQGIRETDKIGHGHVITKRINFVNILPMTWNNEV